MSVEKFWFIYYLSLLWHRIPLSFSVLWRVATIQSEMFLDEGWLSGERSDAAGYGPAPFITPSLFPGQFLDYVNRDSSMEGVEKPLLMLAWADRNLGPGHPEFDRIDCLIGKVRWRMGGWMNNTQRNNSSTFWMCSRRCCVRSAEYENERGGVGSGGIYSSQKRRGWGVVLLLKLYFRLI